MNSRIVNSKISRSKLTNNESKNYKNKQLTINRSRIIRQMIPGIIINTIITEKASSNQIENYRNVYLNIYDISELIISIYPKFKYNAIGAGGPGTVAFKKTEPEFKNILNLEFDTNKIIIPPIDYKSSSIFGIPIPPPLSIKISIKKFKGTLDSETGEANFEFEAEFKFRIGDIYQAPSLLINTNLTTDESNGILLNDKGKRFLNGKGKLVGVSRVPKTGDAFLDNFLMLPTDALATLNVELDFN